MTEVIPRRYQRKRNVSTDIPVNAKYVGRPTKWGNPYPIAEFGEQAAEMFEENLLTGECWLEYSGERHRFNLVEITVEEVQTELRGKDLVCWCALDAPCHADVLLEVANAHA